MIETPRHKSLPAIALALALGSLTVTGCALGAGADGAAADALAAGVAFSWGGVLSHATTRASVASAVAVRIVRMGIS